MPRNLDPFWQYGEPDLVPETGGLNRMYLSCKLCGKHMSGGIYRLKCHIVQIPGQNTELCPNPGPEMIRQAIKALMEKKMAKRPGQ